MTYIPCPECGGQGKIHSHNDYCNTCNGKRNILQKDEFKIKRVDEPFIVTKEEAIQLLDFIRQSGYISYEFHPLISPLADRIKDHYKEERL